MDKTMNEQQEKDFQERCRIFWDRQGGFWQDSLVRHLLEQGVEGFTQDEIENDEYIDEDGEKQRKDVLQWGHVDKYLACLLDAHHEILLVNDFGAWWGRDQSGQAVYMDSVIRKIVKIIEN